MVTTIRIMTLFNMMWNYGYILHKKKNGYNGNLKCCIQPYIKDLTCNLSFYFAKMSSSSLFYQLGFNKE